MIHPQIGPLFVLWLWAIMITSIGSAQDTIPPASKLRQRRSPEQWAQRFDDQPQSTSVHSAGIALHRLPSTSDSISDRLLRLEDAWQRLQESESQRTSAISVRTYETYEPETERRESAFYSDYDSGFVIRPYDKEKTPFELKVNGRLQFRGVGFARNFGTFTTIGGPVTVQNRNDFELERARLMFSGFVYDPNLQFYLNFDGDTDDNHRAVYHDFWFNYVFSPALNVFAGKVFVPGSRSWLDGSTRTHLIDRSMGTTFFRPDRSVGIWAIGEIAEGLYYRAMVGNGFNTTDLRRSGFQIDDNLFYSATMWWEPLGKFGKGYADLEWHECPVIRVGHSFSYGRNEPNDAGAPILEQMPVRLSDGTRLVDSATGVNQFDLYLYAVDFAWKRRGWSFNAEYYFRWLQSIRSGGAFPHTKLYQDGFYADAGYMLVEKRLEVVGRVSLVDGLFKDSWEYAAGINCYVNGTHKNKLSFDVAVLDGSPTANSSPNYEIGMDGLLYRMQWQIAF